MESKDIKYMDCPICTQKRNPVSWVACPKCQFSCCRTCVKTFLLEQPDITPKCMSCKTGWDFEFVANNTDHSFHNKQYRDYRAKILVERERSLLPATQVDATIVKREKEYDVIIQDYNEELKTLKNKVAEITKKIKDTKVDKAYLRHRNVQESKDEEKKVNKFVSNCPQKECKGFLNEKYVCGLCNSKACKKCRSVIHKGDCDKDLVETIQMLARDTRNCPNCRVLIYKISGCSQMFCTSCHTAFSWDTGKIETGRIHNPHYYEFMRKNGSRREIGDVPCGGRVSFYQLSVKIKDAKNAKVIVDSHQLSGHIRGVTLPYYNDRNNLDAERKSLRIKYLLGEINDKTWMSSIKKMEKKREKNESISMVMTMFANTIDDIHRNVLSCPNDEIHNHIDDILRLKEYVNEQMKKISERFDNKAPYVTDAWNIVIR